MKTDEHVVINVSGRGDKDIFNIASALKDDTFNDFLREYLATETQATETRATEEQASNKAGSGGHH